MTGADSSTRAGWANKTSRVAVQMAVISAFLRQTALVILVEYPASSNLVIISSRSMEFKAPIVMPGEPTTLSSSLRALKFGVSDALELTVLVFISIDSPGCWLCDGCKAPVGPTSDTWSTSPCCCALLMAPCPLPTDADRVGDGGAGAGESALSGVSTASASRVGPRGDCAFDPFDLPLVADLIDAASERSAAPESRFEREALGLSDLVPGILDLMTPRKERDDSLVSDLLNDGYDCKPSLVARSREVDDAFVGVLEPSRAFEGCWPMSTTLLKLAITVKISPYFGFEPELRKLARSCQTCSNILFRILVLYSVAGDVFASSETSIFYSGPRSRLQYVLCSFRST